MCIRDRIGTGANDPQKMDPNASRETLDHSIMYIFAVALEDGNWHHVKSYTKTRAKRKSTIKIWRSIKTHEDKKWTRKYHDPNPKKKAFGAKVIITLKNGKKIKSVENTFVEFKSDELHTGASCTDEKTRIVSCRKK